MAANPKKSVSDPKKVMDVSAPGDTPATPTNRPVVVTNRPLANDPMVAPVGTKKSAAQPAETSVPEVSIEHKEKVLQPLADQPSETTEPESSDAPTPTVSAGTSEVTPSPETEETQEATPSESPEPAKAEGLQVERDTFQGEKVPDTDVEASARQAELLELAEQGTYVLPLGSHRHYGLRAFWVVTLLLVAAVVVFDLLLDSGVITNIALPHTDFLQ